MLDFERTPRPLRWYEWLALLLLAAHAAGARGEVYKCIGADGATAFQDRPCAASAHQDTVAIAPASAYTPSPAYAVGPEAKPRSSRRVAPARAALRHGETIGPTSYECRTADGQVFYRHSTCPHSVAAIEAQGRSHPGRGTAAKSSTGKSVAVTSTRIAREEACYELRRAGAAGRSGRSHDQDVSTYNKNLGRDPCR